MKICSICHLKKDESEFYRNRSNKGHLSGECIQCSKILKQRSNKLHPERQAISHRRLKYGADESIFGTLYQSQNGACKLCGQISSNLNIDHDHKTGAIRGLLCNPCNRAIGLFNDDILLLKKAINYLETANTKTTLQQHLMQMLRRI